MPDDPSHPSLRCKKPVRLLSIAADGIPDERGGSLCRDLNMFVVSNKNRRVISSRQVRDIVLGGKRTRNPRGEALGRLVQHAS